jgi:hypothetical protein
VKVRVWQLRHGGVKLPKDGLDGPHVGWLRLERANIAGEVSLHASLHLGTGRGSPALLQSLTTVEVRQLDERGLLLYGRQAEQPAGPAALRHQQAWFCQPVDTAPTS